MNLMQAVIQAHAAHEGEKDKCGADAVYHPMQVACAIEDHWPGPPGDVFKDTAVTVACLHDVWEDTDYELEGLTALQVAILDRLTRREVEKYGDYIERVCGHEIACVVKLADLWHNLSPERAGCLTEAEQRGLRKRYFKARARIWKALGKEWWPA